MFFLNDLTVMPIIGNTQRGGIISAKNQTYRSTSSITNSNATKYAAQRQALQQKRNEETAEKYQEYLNTEAAKREKLYNQISASTDGENVYISDPNHILTESQKQQLAKTGTITTSHGETISFDVNSLKAQAKQQIESQKQAEKEYNDAMNNIAEARKLVAQGMQENLNWENAKLENEQKAVEFLTNRATEYAQKYGKDVDSEVERAIDTYYKDNSNTYQTYKPIEYLEDTEENKAINDLINTTNINIENLNTNVKYRKVEIGAKNGEVYVKDPDNTLTTENINDIILNGKTTTSDGTTISIDMNTVRQAAENQKTESRLKNKDLSNIQVTKNKDGTVKITDTKGTLTDAEKKYLENELSGMETISTINITKQAESNQNQGIKIAGSENKTGVGFNIGNAGSNNIEDTPISYSDKVVAQAQQLANDGDILSQIYLKLGNDADNYEEYMKERTGVNTGESASGQIGGDVVLETLANAGLSIANLPADMMRLVGASALGVKGVTMGIESGNLSEIALTPAKSVNTLGNSVVEGAVSDPSYFVGSVGAAAVGSKGISLAIKGATTAVKGATTAVKLARAAQTTTKISGKTAKTRVKTTATTAKVTTNEKKTTTAKINTNKQSKPSATAASENIVLEPTGGRKVTTQPQNIADNLTTISLKKETPTTVNAKTTTEKTTQMESYVSNAGTKAGNRLTESTSNRTSSKETTGGYGRKYTTDKYADMDVYDSDFMDYLSQEEHTFIDRIWMANGGHLTVKDAIKELQIRNKNIKNAKISEQRAKEYEAEREEKIRQKAKADQIAKDKIASEKFTQPQLTVSTGTGRTGGASSKTKGKKNIDETTQEERQRGRVITQNRVESEGITKSAAEWIDKQPEYVRYAVERMRDAGYKITLPKAKRVGKNATEVKNWIDTQPKYIKDAVKNATKSNYDMDLKTAKRIASEETTRRQKANYPQLKAGTGNENDVTITGYGVKRAYHQTAPTGVTRGMSDKAYKLYLRASPTQREIIDNMIKEGKTVNVSTVKRVMFDNPSTSNSPFLKDRLLLKEGDGITVNAEPYYTPEESARLTRKAQRSKATDPNLTEKEKMEQAKWKEEQDAEELAKAERQRAKRKANPPKARTPKEILTGKNPQRKKLVHGEKVKKGMNRERVDNTENIGKAGDIYPDGNGNEIQLKAKGIKTDGRGNVATPKPEKIGSVFKPTSNEKSKQKILIRNDGTTETITEIDIKDKDILGNSSKTTKKQQKQKHSVINAMKGDGQKRRFINQSKVKKSSNKSNSPTNNQKLTTRNNTKATPVNNINNTNRQRKPNKVNNKGKIVIDVKPNGKTPRLPRKTRKPIKTPKPITSTPPEQIPNELTRAQKYKPADMLKIQKENEISIATPTKTKQEISNAEKTLTATTSNTTTNRKTNEKTKVNESTKVTTISGTRTIIAQATGNAQKQSQKQSQTQGQSQKTKGKGNNTPLNRNTKPNRPRDDDERKDKNKKKRIRKQKYYLRGETVNQFGWLGIDLEPAAKKVRFKL